jgi:hypothetical protein
LKRKIGEWNLNKKVKGAEMKVFGFSSSEQRRGREQNSVLGTNLWLKRRSIGGRRELHWTIPGEIT